MSKQYWFQISFLENGKNVDYGIYSTSEKKALDEVKKMNPQGKNFKKTGGGK